MGASLLLSKPLNYSKGFINFFYLYNSFLLFFLFNSKYPSLLGEFTTPCSISFGKSPDRVYQPIDFIYEQECKICLCSAVFVAERAIIVD